MSNCGSIGQSSHYNLYTSESESKNNNGQIVTSDSAQDSRTGSFNSAKVTVKELEKKISKSTGLDTEQKNLITHKLESIKDQISFFEGTVKKYNYGDGLAADLCDITAWKNAESKLTLLETRAKAILSRNNDLLMSFCYEDCNTFSWNEEKEKDCLDEINSYFEKIKEYLPEFESSDDLINNTYDSIAAHLKQYRKSVQDSLCTKSLTELDNKLHIAKNEIYTLKSSLVSCKELGKHYKLFQENYPKLPPIPCLLESFNEAGKKYLMNELRSRYDSFSPSKQERVNKLFNKLDSLNVKLVKIKQQCAFISSYIEYEKGRPRQEMKEANQSLKWHTQEAQKLVSAALLGVKE